MEKIKVKQEQAEVVGYLNSFKESPIVKTLMAYLEMLIQECRELNDTASRLEYLRLQGEIRAYKKLMGDIENPRLELK